MPIHPKPRLLQPPRGLPKQKRVHKHTPAQNNRGGGVNPTPRPHPPTNLHNHLHHRRMKPPPDHSRTRPPPHILHHLAYQRPRINHHPIPLHLNLKRILSPLWVLCVLCDSVVHQLFRCPFQHHRRLPLKTHPLSHPRNRRHRIKQPPHAARPRAVEPS